MSFKVHDGLDRIKQNSNILLTELGDTLSHNHKALTVFSFYIIYSHVHKCDYNQLSKPQVSSHSHYHDWLMNDCSIKHFVHSAHSVNLNGNVWLHEWVSTFRAQ